MADYSRKETSKYAVQRELALSLLHNKRLKDKFSGSSSFYKGAGAVSLIGADLIEGMEKKTNLEMDIANDEIRANELKARTEIAMEALLDKSRVIQENQKAAYIKSGVELEGSAVNVVAETAEMALKEARLRRREADFEIGQLNLSTALKRVKSDYLEMETLLNAASTGVSLYA